MGKTFSFVSGALFGAAAGAIIGVALAPRSGAETRAMAADIANDAWDNMRDTYEHSAEEARAAVNDFGPMVDAKTDDLRAKVVEAHLGELRATAAAIAAAVDGLSAD